MKQHQIFETVNNILQSSLRDNPNTIIYQNHKLTNTSGNKREFDILIISRLNNTEIQIAIECKDYKDNIPVEKIEAFKTKCDRIPSINKKIFIAKKGFQKDAIQAANQFGIELYLLKDFDSTKVSDWFTNIKAKLVEINISLFRLEIEFEGKKPKLDLQKSLSSIISTNPGDKRVTLKEFIRVAVNQTDMLFPVYTVSSNENLKEELLKLKIEFLNSTLEVDQDKHLLKTLTAYYTKSIKNTISHVSLNKYHKLEDENDQINTLTLIPDKGRAFALVQKNYSDIIEVLSGNTTGDMNGNNFIKIADFKITKI